MPAYNREFVVEQAIRSCQSQSFEDFEVLVIDDASTDSTAESVEGFADPRVRLLRHPVNRGPCESRNTGAAAARGRWLVMLDSDDELAPGAFAALTDLTASAPADVGNVATQCLWDDGRISPDIRFPSAVFDYAAFLRWMDGLAADKVEWFNCVRHEVFEDVQYPSGRTYEGGFHLELASKWRFQISSDVCAYHHTDMEGITRLESVAALADLRGRAVDSLREAERILEEHGRALQRWAPHRYVDYLRAGSFYSLLLGRRRSGARFAVRAIRNRPGDPRIWGTLMLGLLSGDLLGRVKVSRATRARQDGGP